MNDQHRVARHASFSLSSPIWIASAPSPARVCRTTCTSAPNLGHGSAAFSLRIAHSIPTGAQEVMDRATYLTRVVACGPLSNAHQTVSNYYLRVHWCGFVLEPARRRASECLRRSSLDGSRLPNDAGLLGISVDDQSDRRHVVAPAGRADSDSLWVGGRPFSMFGVVGLIWSLVARGARFAA